MKPLKLTAQQELERLHEKHQVLRVDVVAIHSRNDTIWVTVREKYGADPRYFRMSLGAWVTLYETTPCYHLEMNTIKHITRQYGPTYPEVVP